MTADSSRPYGAIDLGGTKVRSIVVDASGRILGDDIRLSDAAEGLEVVLDRMVECLDASLAKAGVKREGLAALGVASPGAVDAVRGIVPDAPQLPGWKDVPLARLLGERFGLPTLLENDATAAALGEHRFGAGRGCRHMLYITISTGVGGGIIIDGEMYRGASGAAGEFGHVIIVADGPPCGCGGRGCLESLVSGTAIARWGEELVATGKSPLLAEMREREGPVTAEMMSRAVKAGDEAALECAGEVGYYLGVALAGFVNVFNPEVIVIGGGVSLSGEMFMDKARATMEQLAMRQPLKDVRLELSALGDFGGALGMVARLREEAEGGKAGG